MEHTIALKMVPQSLLSVSVVAKAFTYSQHFDPNITNEKPWTNSDNDKKNMFLFHCQNCQKMVNPCCFKTCIKSISGTNFLINNSIKPSLSATDFEILLCKMTFMLRWICSENMTHCRLSLGRLEAIIFLHLVASNDNQVISATGMSVCRQTSRRGCCSTGFRQWVL